MAAETRARKVLELQRDARQEVDRWSSGAGRGFMRPVPWNEMLERKRDTR